MNLRDRALDLLKTAEDSLKSRGYWLTCFAAHQSVELYLKGLLYELAGLTPLSLTI